MKVLITGANGQLGRELLATAPTGVQSMGVDRASLDITDADQVTSRIAELKPALIINAAAYTAVDKAEQEPEAAYRVNRDGVAHLAEAARRHGTRLLQISTDYVFDGTKASPYLPDDLPNPISAYGASKLAGEKAALDLLPESSVVVRTAWVYAKTGHNFVKTILRLLHERKELRVVCDQLGTPTHAVALARTLWKFAAKPDLRGIYHCTDAGVASWYDFAVAIAELAPAQAGKQCVIVPIATAEYRTAARRPSNAVLDKSVTWALFGPARHWRSELAGALA